MKQLSRKAILEFLENHADYSERYAFYPIAWSVKHYSQKAFNGRVYNGEPIDGYDNSPLFDDMWEHYLENDNGEWSLFTRCCEDWWGMWNDQWNYFDGHLDQSLSNVSYKMEQHGRSGGNMVLAEFDGRDLRDVRMEEFEDTEEWSYQDLWTLYKFIAEVDRVTSYKSISEFIAYNYAVYREEMETEWQVEIDAANGSYEGIEIENPNEPFAINGIIGFQVAVKWGNHIGKPYELLSDAVKFAKQCLALTSDFTIFTIRPLE